MDDWKVMLLVFSGFVAVVAVCVGLIIAQIVGTHVARRPRADNEGATTIKASAAIVNEERGVRSAHAFAGACRGSGGRVRGSHPNPTAYLRGG